MTFINAMGQCFSSALVLSCNTCESELCANIARSIALIAPLLRQTRNAISVFASAKKARAPARCSSTSERWRSIASTMVRMPRCSWAKKLGPKRAIMTTPSFIISARCACLLMAVLTRWYVATAFPLLCRSSASDASITHASYWTHSSSSKSDIDVRMRSTPRKVQTSSTPLPNVITRGPLVEVSRARPKSLRNTALPQS
mmetsp:Transcript_102564/g.289708  ORF Transcript_102564/g.289708 Transcript_102564/m.289708 type:complete len:200 (+) Transcript_102564:1883-2482(+)